LKITMNKVLNNIRLLAFTTMLLIINSCDDPAKEKSLFPNKGSVNNITAASVKIQNASYAIVNNAPDAKETGIVWNTSPNVSVDSPYKKIAANRDDAREYVIDGLKAKTTYYYKSYVIDSKDKLVYSEEGIFTTLSPVLEHAGGLAPVGSVIEIIGNNFSVTPADNIIKFGDITAAVVGSDARIIKVKVPEGLGTEKVKISVTVGGETVISNQDFVVDFYPFIITSITPLEAYAGSTIITVTGKNFSRKTGFFNVYIGGLKTQIVSYDTTNADNCIVKIIAPTTLAVGEYNVSVEDEYQKSAISAEKVKILPNPWVSKSIFPGGAREKAVSFTIGNKAYMGLGFDGINKRKDFWEYDPATNIWKQKKDFPGAARELAVGFAIGDKGYIGTGDTSSFDLAKDFWEYDPATDNWTRKADFAGTARVGAVGFAIGSKGYITTGMSQSGRTKDCWEYDPATNQWTQKADFGGFPRQEALGFGVGAKGYVGTGNLSSVDMAKDFWEFDPAANSWTRKADLEGEGRSSAAGFVINGKIYIGTGINSSYKGLADFWVFTPQTNSWSSLVNFPGTARWDAVGFAVGTKGYFTTGYERSMFNDTWEFSPTN
jgi:N-acetylneuraminic acid mutarotase